MTHRRDSTRGACPWARSRRGFLGSIASWWTAPNEGGVIGASSPATLRSFLPDNEQYLWSPSWDHHDNPFAARGPQPGLLGYAYGNVEEWTGLNPENLGLDDYAFASGLIQAEGLVEYISNYRRRMFSSASAIFWSYNDSWPCTHNWSIVDYYRPPPRLPSCPPGLPAGHGGGCLRGRYGCRLRR